MIEHDEPGVDVHVAACEPKRVMESEITERSRDVEHVGVNEHLVGEHVAASEPGRVVFNDVNIERSEVIKRSGVPERSV